MTEAPQDPMARRRTVSEKLTSERNMRINDRFAARARLRGLLQQELTPRLRGAREALAGEPVHADVACERIERVLDLMADECAGLDAEDQADRDRGHPGSEDGLIA